ncbi:hypothetical protein CSM81_00075 [Salmonella enterica subsp. enterica serovar Infantis]|nr:hypothetical protein [Salmonella enterica subsp. enterica serovar Infantis]
MSLRMSLYDSGVKPSGVLFNEAVYDCLIAVVEDIETLSFLASMVPQSSSDREFEQMDSFRRLFSKMVDSVQTDFNALQKSLYDAR